MAGRRWLTVLTFGAALALMAPPGSAGADPGTGQAYGHRNGHSHAHAPGDRRGHGHGDRGHQRGHHSASAGAGLVPAARSAHGTTHGKHGHAASRRHLHGGRIRAGHAGHGRGYSRNLGNHPGKAVGLFGHVGVRHDRPQQHVPAPGSVAPGIHHAPAVPRQQPAGHRPAPPTDQPGTEPHTDRDGSNAPPAQQPDLGQEQSLSRLIPQANQLRFTAIPLLIVVALAMGIGGLIRLARHRA